MTKVRRRGVYHPHDREGWTHGDYERFLGKMVLVEIPATSDEEEYYGTPVLGGAGIVVEVRTLLDQTWLDWDYGYTVRVSDDALVRVCQRDHDHNDRNANCFQ